MDPSYRTWTQATLRAGRRAAELLLLLGLLLVDGAGPLYSQAPIPVPLFTPTSPQRVPVGPPADGTPVDLYYLENEEGKLVPVPGLKLEELDQLLRLRRGLDVAIPAPYSISELRLELVAHPEGVQGTVEISIDPRNHGPLRVPLYLSPAVLAGEETVTGAKEYALDIDAAHDGYLFYVNTAPGVIHLKLPIKIPFRSDAETNAFKLTLPNALRSECLFTPPVGSTVLYANGARPEKDSGERSVRLRFENLGTALEVGWASSQENGNQELLNLPLVVASDTVIDVVGPETIRVESNLLVTTETEQSLRAFRLVPPPASHLIHCFEVRDFTMDTAVDSETQLCQYIDFRAVRSIHSPVKVHIVTEQRIDPSVNGKFDVESIQVPGSLRHTGTMKLRSTGNCRVRWTEGDFVFRVADKLNVANDPTQIATFEFYRQPAQLRLQVADRKASAFVQPSYTIDIQPTSMELRGTLRFSFRGAPVSQSNLNSRGWSIVRVEGGNVSGQTSLEPDPNGVVHIAFQRPVIGTEVVQFRAVKAPEAIPGQVTIPIPRIEDANSSPAEIAVVSAENLSLSPVREKMKDYLPQAPVDDLDRSVRDRMPLCYIQRGTDVQSDIIMSVERQARVITVQGRIRCEVQESSLLVTQEMDYDVRNDFLEQIRIRGMAAADGLTWRIDNQLLDARIASAPGFERAAWIIRPPRPRQGPFRLSVRFRLPIPNTIAGSGGEVRIPVFTPMDGVIEALVIDAAAVDAWRVQVATPAWQIDHPPRLTEWTRIGEVDDAPLVEEIPIRLTRNESLSTDVTESKKYFYRIFLSKARRQDYVSWTVATRMRTLRFKLPQGISSAQDAIQVRVDGKLAEFRRVDESEMEVLLPPVRNREDQLLEFVVNHDGRMKPGDQHLELLFPSSAAWGGEWVAELVLPPGEKLATSSAMLVAPPLLQSGPSGSGQEIPARLEGLNRYMLKEPNIQPSLNIVTVTMPWIWFRCALPGLITGWLACWFPLLRSLAIMLVASLLLFSAVLLQPFPLTPALISTWGGLILGWLAWRLFAIEVSKDVLSSEFIEPIQPTAMLDLSSSESRGVRGGGSPSHVAPQEGG
jgi:hypothetical protein